MTRENIVIAPCGNKSFLFREKWLEDNSKRDFDICLLFYHEKIENSDLYKEVDYFFHLKDFKYHMVYKLLTQIHPDWLQKYKRFYFLDDDIDINTKDINKLFLASANFDSWICQASLSRDSYCSWPMFKQKQGSYCRFVGQIEVMAPLFNQDALIKCLPSFIANKSSWGVDSVWSKILGYPQDKLIVFDTIVMRHTLPVGGGELYKKIGVDPHTDWNSIVSLYNAKPHNYKEYGRLQLVNKSNNSLSYFLHKLNERLMTLKRIWNDYNLFSRVKSTSYKVFNKMNLN